ncbi:MAG: aminomethyl transferase family protein [Candidatus Latescibacteria bacterium]|nr:aminomethyl transferase family protein [Candidatus Latescibacterota bacterium]
MKRSSLYDIHRTLYATFVEVAGWEMPDHYGDPLAEHNVVRTDVGLIDLSHRGVLRITGPDRTTFLHNLVTNDITSLSPGMGCYAAILNPKGRILADMRVSVLQDSLLLDTEPELPEKLYSTLDRYLIADDAVLDNVTEQVGSLGVYGPQSSTLIGTLLGADLPEQEHHFILHDFGGASLFIARSEITGEVGYDLFAPVEALPGLWETLCEKGRSMGVRPVGLQALNTLRIEAGIPRYGVDMDEETIALEARLEQRAISFTKGCYIGQEVVARATYRGHVNWLLSGLQVEGEAVPSGGDKVFDDDREVGHITSAILSPTLHHPIAFAYLRREVSEPDRRLTLIVHGASLSAEVVALPFYER